jgi:cytoskeletal protein RodZ
MPVRVRSSNGIRPRGEEARVSIGATLAAARRRAGLTVSDVSQRTRVTEPIIRGIEQDDYAACGGDFYARGHIRAIARAVGEDPVPLIDEFDSTWRSAKEVTAAEVFQPAMPLRKRERRRVRWAAVLAVLVLAVLGFATYKFVSGVGRARPTAATSPRPSPPGGPTNPPASAPAVQGSTAQSTSAQASASQASTSPAPSASPVPVQVLAPASVTAFGPAGRGDGDDPQRAALAIGGDRARPWISQWYATARFGALKQGTGLLLDMGRPVTVASVRVSLVNSGADIQLRAGSKPVPAWLPVVAHVSNAGRTAQLKPAAPVHVRYLLIWFTKLPPDNEGHYRAGVYRITVLGHR